MKQSIFKNAIFKTAPSPRNDSTYVLGKSISFERGNVLSDSSIGGGLDRKNNQPKSDNNLMNEKLGSVLSRNEAPNFFQKKGYGMLQKVETDRHKDDSGFPGLNTSATNGKGNFHSGYTINVSAIDSEEGRRLKPLKSIDRGNLPNLNQSNRSSTKSTGKIGLRSSVGKNPTRIGNVEFPSNQS